MPLLKGKQNIGRNIKTEMMHGKPRKQAIAIAMDVAGMGKNHPSHAKLHARRGMQSHR